MPDKIAKFIASLDKKTRQKLEEKLKAIKEHPFHMSNIKALQAYGKKCYRFRMGNIRIIYVIQKNGVEIIDIDYRGHIY